MGFPSNCYTTSDKVLTLCRPPGKFLPGRRKDMLEKKVAPIFSVATPATPKKLNAAKGKDIPVIFAVHDPGESAGFHLGINLETALFCRDDSAGFCALFCRRHYYYTGRQQKRC